MYSPTAAMLERIIFDNEVLTEGSERTVPIRFGLFRQARSDRPSAKAAMPCTVSEKGKTFRCEHTYPVSGAKTYQITLTARDDDGGEDTATYSIQVP